MSTSQRIGIKHLRSGGRYLHNNGLFIRTIERIDRDKVHWHDQHGAGICSRKAFLKQCPFFAPDDSPRQVPIPKVSKKLSAPNEEFSIRDEANALTAYAFRNGFIEEIHAGKPSPLLRQFGYSRISDDEMRRLMIEASEKLAQMLALKRDNPQRYEEIVRAYHMMYCQGWQRE